jgi:LiaF transmembrane domain
MVNRKFLYWGVFFVAIGAVLLADQGNLISGDSVAPALGLWPVVIIALGVALVLRRTRAGMTGGVIAAALPGLLLGGLVVAAPNVTTPGCRVVQPSSYTTRQGTFGSQARVTIDLSCGDLEVAAGSGSDWRIDVGSTGVPEPRIDASGDGLSISSSGRRSPFTLDHGDVWHVTLPDAQRLDLSGTIDAGSGRFDLAGMQLGALDLDVNAGTARVDLTGTTVDTMTLRVNAGSAQVRLPDASDTAATVNANAARVSLCVPSGVGIRVNQTVVLGSTQLAGLIRFGDAWQSLDYDTATHHADVTLKVNVGSVDVNPEGGCK